MRYLIICCDGTWYTRYQQTDGKWTPSNVALMAEVIRNTDQQLVYYDEGVGSGGLWDRFWGGVFGFGMFANIKQAYRFICDHYQADDQLILLGFSRGAYTVRSLAGLIGATGILRARYIDKLEEIFALYRQKNPDKQAVDAFREQYCHPQREILFLGVWDTVGSLGIPLSSFNWLTHWYFRFHNTQLSTQVKNAFHAIAIDEKRRSFTPVLWQSKQQQDTPDTPEQTVSQCWFAGVHANIGGGYKDAGLSDVAFAWMRQKMLTIIPRLQWDEAKITRLIHPDFRGALPDPLSWLYPISRLFPQSRTPLFYRAINESIDDSVILRYHCHACDYQPTNVDLNAYEHTQLYARTGAKRP